MLYVSSSKISLKNIILLVRSLIFIRGLTYAEEAMRGQNRRRIVEEEE